MTQPQIQRIGPDRKEEQIRLFNATFHINFSSEQWDAKHFHNPYTGMSENFGMIDQGELVGFNMFMPQEYCVNHKPYLLAYSCESVVRADHRGRGYLKTILSEAERPLSTQYDLIYATPNRQSRRTFEKLGYQLKYEIDSLILPGNLPGLSCESIQRVLKIKKISKKPDLDTVLERAFSGSGVKIFRTCPTNINWGFDADSGCIHPHRSEVFYRWKIDSYTPVDQTRRYFCLEEADQVKVFCVASFSFGKASYIAQILDLYVRSDAPQNIQRLIKGLRRACCLIKILAPSQGRYRAALSKAGFRVHQKAISPLMYKLINKESTELESEIRRDDSWDFRFIEVDTVFN